MTDEDRQFSHIYEIASKIFNSTKYCHKEYRRNKTPNHYVKMLTAQRLHRRKQYWKQQQGEFNP